MKSTFFVKVIIQSLFFDQKIQRIKLFIFLKFWEKKKRKLLYYKKILWFHWSRTVEKKNTTRVNGINKRLNEYYWFYESIY